MAKLFPIIKKNLINVKRNLFKSILQMFYPTIILGYFLWFLFQFEKGTTISQRTNYFPDATQFTLSSTDPIRFDLLTSDSEFDFGIISDDEGLTKDLSKFALTTGKY